MSQILLTCPVCGFRCSVKTDEEADEISNKHNCEEQESYWKINPPENNSGML